MFELAGFLHAEFDHHLLRAFVEHAGERIDERQVQHIAGILQAAACAFGGVTLAPGGSPQAPAYFHTGREIRFKAGMIETNEADELFIMQGIYRIKAVTMLVEMRFDPYEHLGCFFEVERGREKLHHLGVGGDSGEWGEIGILPFPEAEAPGLEEIIFHLTKIKITLTDTPSVTNYCLIGGTCSGINTPRVCHDPPLSKWKEESKFVLLNGVLKKNVMNSEVTEYMEKLQPWQMSICKPLRQMVFDTVPDIEERLQYGKPHYLLNGRYACVISAAKGKISFMIFNATELAEIKGFFTSNAGPDRKTATILHGRPVDYSQLAALLKQAVSTL